MQATQTRAEQMADNLRAQEIRGMERYATDQPSETWGAEFQRKLALWRRDLARYEEQESAETGGRS